MTSRKNQGFTLIELMLAMAFISFLLLFMVSAVFQVTRLYVKGLAIRQINQTGRQVMDDVTASLRTGTAAVMVDGYSRLCVGNTSYAWNIDSSVAGENEHPNKFSDSTATLGFVSVQDGGNLCKDLDAQPAKSASTDLIGSSVAVLQFSAEPQGNDKLWNLYLVLSTSGSNIARQVDDGFACDADNQFCAFGDFQTTVYSRGGK